jgi:hypothetical protein
MFINDLLDDEEAESDVDNKHQENKNDDDEYSNK